MVDILKERSSLRSPHEIPTLAWCNLRQICGSPSATLFIVEFYANTMSSYFPVQIILSIFKMSQDGNIHMQLWKFFSSDRAEARIFQGTDKEVVIH